uniref:MCM10 OB-fold domain-containing protein n=1 Tax=Oncorhynchus tshawytscha TaxID=74940 RepID=A0AAZ3QB93_ONCTS
MDRKMADRKLIWLSQLPERLAREKLEESTPQSNSSGKTFSIWKLSDLHELEVYVRLFLFGTCEDCCHVLSLSAVGLLSCALSLQTVMCSLSAVGGCRTVYECQYCQYHVKAQYKKMSAQQAELQSSFSGKVKGKGNSLKERLMQYHNTFFYSGR